MKLFLTNPMSFEGTPEEIESLIQRLNKMALEQKKMQRKAAATEADNAFEALATALFKKIDTEDGKNERPE